MIEAKLRACAGRFKPIEEGISRLKFGVQEEVRSKTPVRRGKPSKPSSRCRIAGETHTAIPPQRNPDLLAKQKSTELPNKHTILRIATGFLTSSSRFTGGYCPLGLTW